VVVLEPFKEFLNLEELHCLVLAASEGSSCAIATATPQLYLEDVNPLFFSSGEHLCGTIDNRQEGTTYNSFLIPEIGSPPLGLVWPTTTNIGFDKCKESFRPFLQALSSHH
jgi:hypothetical protein